MTDNTNSNTNNSLITGVNPTFFLYGVNYDNIATSYNSGKYSTLPPLKYVPNTTGYIAHTVERENKPIGFKIALSDGTVLTLLGREYRYGICSNCRTEYKGYVSWGIPDGMTRTSDSITFTVGGEFCSPECAYSFYKRNGKSKVKCTGDTADSETMLHLIMYLLWGTSVTEAPDVRLLIPYGTYTTLQYRVYLHMIPEYIQPVPITN
jgi:hypothetical protein